MNIIALSAAAIVAAAVCIVMRRYNSEYSMFVSVAFSAIVFAVILSAITPVTNFIKELTEISGINNEYITILLKSLAVCYITQIASDCCNDSGESAIASKIDFAGKIALLLISVPLFEGILGIVKELINQ